MNPIKIDYYRLSRKWLGAARSIVPNWIPDEASEVMKMFFSDMRENKWPKLEHTPLSGLCLVGGRGIGKTISFKTMVKLIFFDPNTNSQMWVIDVLEIEEGYRHARSQDTDRSAEWLYKLVNYPILVIDDLGRENKRFNDYGARNLVMDILMLRYVKFQRGLVITHATSNFPFPLLKEMYSDNPPFTDRLEEMFNFTVLSPAPSKRENPPPAIKVDTHPVNKIIAKTEYLNKIEYLEYFANQILNDNATIFYDRGSMWLFLVKFGFVTVESLEIPEIQAEAKKIAENLQMKRRANLRGDELKIVMDFYTMDKEIINARRHLIMRLFFSQNKIDFRQFTPEQLSF
jgi:hypothetical protein